MKKIIGLVVLIILLIGGYLVYSYLAPGDYDFEQTINQIESEIPDSNEKAEYKIEVVAENLYVPWSIVFSSPDKIFFTERNGSIRLIENGQLAEEPLISFDEISTGGEEGLMGLTLGPDYSENNYLYSSLAYPKNNGLVVKVVRLIDEGDSIKVDKVILDDIPADQYHAGSRIKFGPDGKLYVTTGDATDGQLAQNMETLAGKILRINPDGSIPNDNPFEDSLIYSLGHRNPQGIDWHPESGELYETEHGPSGFDGPGGGDEVNMIQAGKNYGWPIVSHKESQEGLIDPLLVFTPAVAPASGMFYSENLFPQFRNNFFFGMLKGEGIMRVVFSEDEPSNVIAYEKLAGIDVGRVREIAQSPNGEIYFSTSNEDGRGDSAPNDDKIYRLVRKDD